MITERSLLQGDWDHHVVMPIVQSHNSNLTFLWPTWLTEMNYTSQHGTDFSGYVQPPPPVETRLPAGMGCAVAAVHSEHDKTDQLPAENEKATDKNSVENRKPSTAMYS